jgi:imidazolonepropionase
MKYDLVIKNARIITMDSDNRILDNAQLAIKDGCISHFGAQNDFIDALHMIDAKHQLLTPGLIDCHTHLIYAGNRADEFALRQQGVSYAEIAQRGGGIIATVKATRQASIETLTAMALQRAKIMLAHGTTTVEIKSGYGLDTETEIKMLKVARALANQIDITVISTFLGAHAIPPEFKQNADGYIDHIISEMLPRISNDQLAVFIDAFCESIAFTPAQVERLFQAAMKYGFKIKLHAEQLTDQKAAVLAAKYQACSVDHLEFLAADDCKMLANGKTVAVLLPGAYYFLKESKLPPLAALRDQQIPIAIATDANPGSSPFLTLPLMMNMGCILFGLSVDEVWRGVTIHAAKALDMAHQIGSIETGKQADLILWACHDINDVVYNPTVNYCNQIIKAGRIL